jgi:sigma-B regulation protein RsbU (phosphoserine phosphatase)
MKISSPVKQNDDLFEVVLNTVSDGVTVIDQDLKIKFQNKIITELYGSSMIGKHCFNAYRGRNIPCEDCKIIDVLKDGRDRRIIRDVALPNGETLLIELNSAAIRDKDGNIIGAVEVARDVTEQKKAEALLNKTLLKQNKVLRQLNSELSDATGYIKTVLPQPITSGPLLTDWKFIPSVSLAGDSFGYHWIDEDHFAMYLLDVSGHGWGAALLSVSVINVLRSHALPDTNFLNPHEVLFALNNAFPSEKHNDLFFTIWYGVYDTVSHNLVYASGGHPPAILFSGSSPEHIQMDQLRTPNIIMGGKLDNIYESEIKAIRRPSRLYVFSDGVYDITKTDGSIWGFKDFLEFNARSFKLHEANLDCLLAHAQELAQAEVFDDDFTIMEITFE